MSDKRERLGTVVLFKRDKGSAAFSGSLEVFDEGLPPGEYDVMIYNEEAKSGTKYLKGPVYMAPAKEEEKDDF